MRTRGKKSLRGQRHLATRTKPVRKWLVVPLGLLGAIAAVGAAWLAFRAAGPSVANILAVYDEHRQYGGLTIEYPQDGTLFPAEIPPPTFRWRDRRSQCNLWLVTIQPDDGGGSLSFLTPTSSWRPADDDWAEIKRRSRMRSAAVAILGVDREKPGEILSGGRITIATSRDEVGAPLFYREVNLPFRDAVKDPSRIRWRFGSIDSAERPPIVLEKLPVCGNCHSFSADGSVLGMDVDYANDKGSYAIAPVEDEMVLDNSKIITWSDYRREDGEPTFGLLSQVSPDGRYVISTVKDRSVFVATDDLEFSQLFFPVQGILAVYDRQTKQFQALPGADDPQWVQSNATWSPDGKSIVFAKGKAVRLKNLKEKAGVKEVKERVLLAREECREFLEEGQTFLFDLYRIEFNSGRGGNPEPLTGASHNGASNYFPKYSPDGKWIVFCKAKSFMLLQPDSKLFIIPAEGGEAREMRCNTPRMNSWHSWSPNGKWLVFSSKANSPYTQLFLTHIDERGQSSPAVLLERFTAADRAANIPEFVNIEPGAIKRVRERFIDDHSYVRAAKEHYRGKDLDRAAEALRNALAINPANTAAVEFLGEILLLQGGFPEAETRLRKLIDLDPENAAAHYNLAVALRRQDRVDEAVEHCRESLKIDPASARTRTYLGNLLLGLGKTAEARVQLAEAVQLDPTDTIARFALAAVLEREKKLHEYARQLDEILKQQPDFLPALMALASVRALSEERTLRDGKEAVRLAERACNLTGHGSAEAMDLLAAAYAEADRLPDAVAAARAALRLAHAQGKNDFAGQIAQRLRRYQKGQPNSLAPR